ncbi:MAG: type II toxin-antitoxin system VapC family toxin [Gemmatimonadota bacterium]|nr:type II toxin-antitoxin system VapC family toxin [Gemmatimonadota bacterium]
MVIDTSAMIAVLLNEPTADRLVAAIEADHTRLVSAATVVEASLVILGRYGEAGDPQLDRLLRGIGAEVVPVGEEQVVLARDAALRFGRGRHAASLNFGDCFSYALSVARGEPLLFVGDDFTKTDVEVCAW